LSISQPRCADVTVIEMRVFRFDPQAGAPLRYESYSVPTPSALTALEVLDFTSAHLDLELAHRSYCCPKGMSLSCPDRIHGCSILRDLAVDLGTAFGASGGGATRVARDGAVLTLKAVAGPAEGANG